MASRARWALAAAAVALTLSACQPNRFVTGWVPYWGATSGRALIDDAGAAQLLGEVSMMWYGTNPDGTLGLMASASGLKNVADSARAKGLPVVPTVFDRQPAGVMLGILNDPARRTAHVNNIVALVTANGYDGIDIDYEVFPWGDGITKEDPRITPAWVAFVQQLGDALHQRGKVLSVTVPPVWTVESSGGSSVRGYTVYAQAQIAPYVDRLRLMVYDWSVSSPGPIAPMWWVQSVIAYSSAIVPTAKLQLGVPAYGRHWTTQLNAKEVCPDGALTTDSVRTNEVAALAAAHGVTPVRQKDGELTFSWTQVVTGLRTKPIAAPPYVPPATTIGAVSGPVGTGLQPALRLGPPPSIVTCTVLHSVYAPDAQSIRDRADTALAAGWSGIAVWAFGYETPDVYTLLGGVAPQRPDGTPYGTPYGTLDEPVVDGTSVRVTGLAVHPEFDLPVGVHLTVTPTGTPSAVADRTVTARVSRAGLAAGLGPFHGFDESFTGLAAGSYDVCATMVLWGGTTGPLLGCRTATVTTAP